MGIMMMPNALRFLSRAALEMLPCVDFKPDIIHCNDWQTAMTPVYYHMFYANQGLVPRDQNLIHDSQHSVSGQIWHGAAQRRARCPAEQAHLLEYEDCVNILKGAIECATG